MRIHLTKAATVLVITTLTFNALGRPIDVISDASDLPNLIVLYKNGDYRNAYRGLLPLAKAGDPIAQSTLGRMYMRGEGVEKNYQTAVEWFLQAAESDEDEAQNRLGILYEAGNGVAQDMGKAEM